MTEQHTSPPGAQRPRLAGPVQLLRRSTSDRKLAGVCGGLGAYTNIDPLVFRVLFAVFSLFGGFGLLLYGAGWLIIPEEGQEKSEGQRLLQGQGTSAAAAWASGATVLGLIVFIAVATEQWEIIAWLVVITGIAYFIVRSRYPAATTQVPPWWRSSGNASDGPAPAGQAGASGEEPTSGGYGSPDTGPAAHAVPPTSAPPAASSSAASSAASSPVSPPPPASMPPTSPLLTPPPPRKEPRSITGWLAFSAALIVSGVLAILDLSDVVDVPAVVVMAVALVILGVGLVVAAWFGRARGLIIPAVLLVIALAIGTALGSTLRGPVGELEASPRTAGEIDDPYRLAIGELTIDLRELDFGGRAASIEASVGLGVINVIYPDDVRIDATTSFGIGNVETSLAGNATEDGERVRTEPTGELSRGTITLDLSVGVGSIEFRQGARR